MYLQCIHSPQFRKLEGEFITGIPSELKPYNEGLGQGCPNIAERLRQQTLHHLASIATLRF